MIRIVVLACLALACRDERMTRSDQSPWRGIAALAKPAVAPGPHEALVPAIELAKKHRDAWTDLRYRQPPTPLAEYPDGERAMSALAAWAGAKGGLPPLPPFAEVGVQPMAMYSLGAIAVEANAPGARYLGHRLVREGRNLLEVMMGVTLLRDSVRKTGDTADLPTSAELVRIVAAEATHSRRLVAYATSVEGQRAMREAEAKLDPQMKSALLGGRTFDREMAAAMDEFWAAALDGARPGEPASTTVARLRAAADKAPESIASSVQIIPSSVEVLAKQLDDLTAPK